MTPRIHITVEPQRRDRFGRWHNCAAHEAQAWAVVSHKYGRGPQVRKRCLRKAEATELADSICRVLGAATTGPAARPYRLGARMPKRPAEIDIVARGEQLKPTS